MVRKLVFVLGLCMSCSPGLKYSEQYIENLVKKVETGGQAFKEIKDKIKFTGDCDDKVYHRAERWTSLIETYNKGWGDCEDGAIAFSALLNDNTETKLVLLKPHNPGMMHVIALYKENGKWGYVSFNETDQTKDGLKVINRISKPRYDTIDDAIKGFDLFGLRFKSYQIIEIPKKLMKYGTNLETVAKFSEEHNLQW